MKYLQIDSDLFINNRKLFAKKIKSNSMAIFNSNDVMPTNADGTMPFKQNSDLFWLTGIDQEDSVLIIFPSSKDTQHKKVLFLKETNELIAIWEGQKLTKQTAFKTSGIKTIYGLSDFDKVLSNMIEKADSIYLNKNTHSRLTSEVETRDDRFRKKIIKKYPKQKINEVAPIMHDLRSIKSENEIKLMQIACDITGKAFNRVLSFIKPGVTEYEIEAELAHEFLINRATGFAYQPIIASGKNSCVLHYNNNNKICEKGEILLMDFGSEYANYSSDLTRTIPVNGRFSKRQKEVYNSVLKVMKEAIAMLRPGIKLKTYNKEVCKIMEEELINLKLLSKHDVQRQNPKTPLYKKYFMHGISHYIGLDTHDVGDNNATINEGMVFTCEPGIYIASESLGIRLENDILVTKEKPFDLMQKIPIEIDEIEELMNT